MDNTMKVSLACRGLIHLIHFAMLLLWASCSTVPPVEPAVQVDTFSKLKEGDSLIVRYHTSGCFHDATHELAFRREKQFVVSITRLSSLAVRSGVVSAQTNRVELGTLNLSQSDIAGLDSLMLFYRSGHNSSCTTVDEIVFTQQREGEAAVTEQIMDRSCQTYELKRVTRFSDLIDRLSSRKR